METFSAFEKSNFFKSRKLSHMDCFSEPIFVKHRLLASFGVPFRLPFGDGRHRPRFYFAFSETSISSKYLPKATGQPAKAQTTNKNDVDFCRRVSQCLFWSWFFETSTSQNADF